jgi:hypothetical protein
MGSGLFDSQRAPTQNVGCPASTTDRRDICLLLTQDVGFFLQAKKRAGSTPRSQPRYQPTQPG